MDRKLDLYAIDLIITVQTNFRPKDAWNGFRISRNRYSHPFLIIGSFWSDRVWKRIWNDWAYFHTINQACIEKSIFKSLGMLRIDLSLHYWSTTFIHFRWSASLDEKESESENAAIDLVFSQSTNFDLKIDWKWLKILWMRILVYS